MKKFEFSWYEEQTCPLGVKVERAVNTCGSTKDQLNSIRTFMSPDDLLHYMLACIMYWSEAEHWDARNQYAVLVSKRIAEQHPELDNPDYPDVILKNAYGFTQEAHRALQHNFFECIMRHMKDTGHMGIAGWVEAQEFVYADDNKSVIPYSEYQKRQSGLTTKKVTVSLELLVDTVSGMTDEEILSSVRHMITEDGLAEYINGSNATVKNAW